MRLISGVEISRFRSIEYLHLEQLSDLCSLVGPNNAGKSNVLRMLNLFFNDQTEPDVYLDFSRDFHMAGQSRKKKQISCSVSFTLPEHFRFRKGTESAQQFLHSDTFTIRKTWGVGLEFEPSIDIQRHGEQQYQSVDPRDVIKINQFLSVISFRYIPNRAVPAEVLRAESAAIQRELARRVANYGTTDSVKAMLAELSESAAKMVRPIAEQIRSLQVGVAELELDTPEDLASLVVLSIFRASVGTKGRVEDTALGAGVQAVLMFAVMHDLIDGAAFKNFGWKQAAVWAIEEPESALHHGLAVQLATLLRRYAFAMNWRFQILSTTHSPVFVESATSGYLVSLSQVTHSTSAKYMEPHRLATTTSDVTGFVPPGLAHFFHTLVVVEGPFDVKVLTRAAELLGMAGNVRFACPSQLDPNLTDGVDNVYEFVKRHRALAAERLPAYPLRALVDWDASAKLPSLRSKLGQQGAMAFQPEAADDRVGSTFKGIERFYPYEFLQLAESLGFVEIAVSGNGTLVIDRDQLESAKGRLATLFCERATPTDCHHLAPALHWAVTL